MNWKLYSRVTNNTTGQRYSVAQVRVNGNGEVLHYLLTNLQNDIDVKVVTTEEADQYTLTKR